MLKAKMLCPDLLRSYYFYYELVIELEQKRELKREGRLT